MTAPGNYPALLSAGVAVIPEVHQSLLSAARRECEIGAVSSVSGPYSGWPNRATVAITNPVSLTNYQHLVIVPWSPGMKGDFSDIRFAQVDGTACQYWIESYTLQGSALVWVLVPIANQKLLYLYYGNPQAEDESTIAIFEEFDHFDGASLGAGWTQYGSNSPTVADSICSISLSGSAKDCGFFMNDMYSSPAYAFRARIKPSAIGVTSGWTGKILWGLVDGHYTDTNYDWAYASILAPSSADAPKYLSNHSGGTQAKDTMAGTSYSDGMTAGNWCVQEVRWFGSATNHVWRINDKYQVTVTRYADQPLRLDFYVYSDSIAGLDIDWVLVRKCAATEPVCSVIQAGPRADAYRPYYPSISTIPADLTPERTDSGIEFTGSSYADHDPGAVSSACDLSATASVSHTLPAGERVSVCPTLWNGLGMRVIEAAPAIVLPGEGPTLTIGGNDHYNIDYGTTDLNLAPDSYASLVEPSGDTALDLSGDDRVYPPPGEETLSLHGHSGFTEAITLLLTPSATSQRGAMGGLTLSCESTIAISQSPPTATLTLAASAVRKKRVTF